MHIYIYTCIHIYIYIHIRIYIYVYIYILTISNIENLVTWTPKPVVTLPSYLPSLGGVQLLCQPRWTVHSLLSRRAWQAACHT